MQLPLVKTKKIKILPIDVSCNSTIVTAMSSHISVPTYIMESNMIMQII